MANGGSRLAIDIGAKFERGTNMASKRDLSDWVYGALRDNGGSATLLEVARYIWQNHEADLRASGDLFYTWQYDMRWAATELRRLGKVADPRGLPRGVWALKSR